RYTIRPTRFFVARTRSAIPRAARTACSTGLSASVPTDDSRRASTTMTTSPERSPSYSFVKSRSRRADAFQLMRRTSSPATYSRTPQNSLPGPTRREDVRDLDQVEGRALVPDDQFHVDLAARVRPVGRQRPQGNDPGPRGRRKGSEGEDDHGRQGEEQDLPTPEHEAEQQETHRGR